VIHILDTSPDVDVEEAEFVRLLGYPPGRELEGRVAELAAWARAWYAEHGRPWVFVCGTEDVRVRADEVAIEGVVFTPARLRSLLLQSDAHAVALAAVSAGPELEAESARLWALERPDEYYFLEILGSAVVEHLAMRTGARLCAWSEAQGMAVMPHDSPGYPGWDIGEQPRLLELTARRDDAIGLPGPLRALDSGALLPKKSLLAVYGLTPQADARGRLSSLVPCDNCSLPRCQYRRRPYRSARGAAEDVSGSGEASAVKPAVQRPALHADASYRTNAKALRRWARERLSLAPRSDGGVDAVFRYDGTTCTNMGRELTFIYTVTLGPPEEGYPLREQHCGPAPGDQGHAAMCGYIRSADSLRLAIATEHPLAGRPLDAVLSWARPMSSAGCYCDASSREHKWGLVLETIHFALAERARGGG